MAPQRGALCAAVALSLPQAVTAWSDHGNMLTAAIAKAHLKDGLAEKIEKVLSCSDAGEFSNFNTLPRASTWMSKLECPVGINDPECAGLDRRAFLSLFKGWGKQSKPHNPNNIELPSGDKGFDWAEENLENALVNIAESLNPSNDQIPMPVITSMWSFGLQLRVLLHIFSNAHQPHNTGTLFDQNGFAGVGGSINGEEMKCESAECTAIAAKNYYDLWDMGFGDFAKPWAELTDEVIAAHANEIMTAHTPDSFIGDALDRLDPGWNNTEAGYGLNIVNGGYEPWVSDVATQSFELMQAAYEPWLINASRDNKIWLNSATWARFKTNASQQVALGGYRLSSLLNAMADNIPEEPCSTSPPGTTSSAVDAETTTKAADEADGAEIFGFARREVLAGVIGFVIGILVSCVILLIVQSMGCCGGNGEGDEDVAMANQEVREES